MHNVVYFLGERSKCSTCSQINLPLINFNRFIFPLGVMKCELRSAYIFKNYARRADKQKRILRISTAATLLAAVPELHTRLKIEKIVQYIN